MAANVTIIN